MTRAIFPAGLLALGAALAPSHALAPDPGVPGPLAVTVAEYDFGDSVFTPTDLDDPVEMRAVVHYPTGLPGGPYPLVLFLHGRHSTCYDGGDFSMDWPCEAPLVPIPSHRGYDYVSQILASHGYIVVSISANGISAQDGVDDLGALARAELLQEHLDVWNDYNTVGGVPFGNAFVGKVDVQRVGTMGHSRGGEGAVRHVMLNRDLGSPYGIQAVFALAPLNSERFTIHGVSFAVLLPYCDGDVNTLEGVSFFDDSRYNQPGDSTAKHSILVLGANHNYYNTNWTPSIFPTASQDDWEDWGSEDIHCGPDEPNDRLTDAEQRGTGIAYFTAFYRTYLGGESQFLPILVSEAPPASALTEGVYVAYHPPDDPAVRRDVNRLLEEGNLSINTVGGATSASGLTPYDLCGGSEQPRCLPEALFEAKEPHSALDSILPGMSQLRLGWDDATARWVNELPPGGRDASRHGFVQFRASVNFSDERNAAGLPQDLSVTVVDGAGLVSSVAVGPHTRALFYPPGSPPEESDFNLVPRVVLNTVRVPLAAFSGVFLQDVRSIRLDFDQEAEGALLLGDLMLADAAADQPPSVTCSVATEQLMPTQHRLLPVGLDIQASDDLDPGVTVDTRVFGDEDDVEPGSTGDFSPDARDIAEGTLRLRAERRNNGDGRVYLVLVSGEDSTGHVGYGCCTVVVPHNQSAESIASAEAQAAAAEARCTEFAAFATGLGGLPAPYFAVGDGPVIGPKQ
jgi:hypothetical protein